MERQHLWGNPPDDSDESWWPGAKRPADEALGPSSFSSNLSNPQREPESLQRDCAASSLSSNREPSLNSTGLMPNPILVMPSV